MRCVVPLLLAAAAVLAAEPAIPPVPDKQPEPPFPKTAAGAGVTMLVPGFVVRELPVKLTSLNNIEYAADGRLFAGGYDGRFHLLRDLDGDGLEETVETFSPETSQNYPLGMAVKDGMPYAVLTDEVVRWRDTDGDGIPDLRETVVKGFDDPELVAAPYLNHRRVDSSMAIAFGPDGGMYVSMGNAGYNNAYWHDQQGVAHYAPQRRRGCLLHFHPDGKVTQFASGLRYIMSLQFNEHGALFGTDQEGATWVPNGNPFDELLHIQSGNHYGFPPRHPRWLPEVMDEPSVFDYRPQHESTCGFRFNGPAEGRGRFGPEWWAHDAIVTGESRGKLWRTKLARTAGGYVAQTQLIARLGMMPVDCAISPRGDLVVCCHSGRPDWGNGPKGEGRIFKISYEGGNEPQPVLVWPASETQTVIAFDRPVAKVPEISITSGRYVAAADELEAFRPGYAVVKMQQRQPRTPVAVSKSMVEGPEQRHLVIESERRPGALEYAVSARTADEQPSFHLAHDLSGVSASWVGLNGEKWTGWLPHADTTASRAFTAGSAIHDLLWEDLKKVGTLTLRGQLDLWQLLTPPTQPGSKLDYEPEPETITLTFRTVRELTLEFAGAKVEREDPLALRVTVTGAKQDRWRAFTVTAATPALKSEAIPEPDPASMIEVYYHTSHDPFPRALPLRRFLLPFAKPSPPDDLTRTDPRLSGGNWQAGRELFRTKAGCVVCHQLRGDGVRVGPELGNLVHRDYDSVLKDIVNPNAVINPDAVGYMVTLRDGNFVAGTRLAETNEEVQIAQVGGAVAVLKKAEIAKTEPLPFSLMPEGLEKELTADELRDLMTYLLTEEPGSNK